MSYRRKEITEAQALNFYRELCKKVYGDPDKNCGGVMSVALIAEHMNITRYEASNVCHAMISYGITEFQNGMIVV